MTTSPLPGIGERMRAVVEADHRRWRPPPPRRAATVALLQDTGTGLNVYLLRRSATMAAAAAMHVFPGGSVEPADGPLHDPDTTRIAALRELAEETGVTLGADGAELVRFARWVTPEVLDHRHDTDFFATRLPAGARPVLVGTEAVAADWTTPAQALDQAAQGQIGLLPPTWAALHLLAQFDSVDAALAGLAGRAVPPLMPVPVKSATGYSWELQDVAARRLVTDPAEYGLPTHWRPLPPVGGPG